MVENLPVTHANGDITSATVHHNIAQRCCRVSNQCDVIVAPPLTSRPHCYLIEFSDNHVISIGARYPQNSVSLIPQVQLIALSIRINERRDSRHTKCVSRIKYIFIRANVGNHIHVIRCILLYSKCTCYLKKSSI